MDIFTWMNDNVLITTLLFIPYLFIGLFWYSFVQSVFVNNRMGTVAAVFLVFFWPYVAVLALIMIVYSLGESLGSKLR